jgi:hypothetical protein
MTKPYLFLVPTLRVGTQSVPLCGAKQNRIIRT